MMRRGTRAGRDGMIAARSVFLLIPLLAVAAASRVDTAAPVPSAIGIDFVGRGTVMGTQEKAGVVAQGFWNGASGVSRTAPLGLVDLTGAATGATVTWTSDNVWSTGIADASGNNRMMRGYLDNGNGGTIRIAVSGLPSGADHYVYVDGDNGSTARTGIYQVTAPGAAAVSRTLTDAANATFTGTFRLANNSSGNYLRFPITGTSFTLTATPGQSAGVRRAPINALQIVPTGAPAPADFTLSAAPGSQTVVPGASTTYAVNVAGVNGFAGVVTLNAAGLPAGATATFTPSSVTGSGTATLTVTTSAAVQTGSWPLTVTGTSGTLVRTAAAAIVVDAVPAFSLSGTLSPSTLGLGRDVALGGFRAATTVADGEGKFRFDNLPNGSYVVTPTGSGYAFTPPSRTITIAGASVEGLDFAVAIPPQTFSISGSVTSVGASGTTLSLSGPVQRSVVADAAGHYAVADLSAGTYTVTPAKPGYAFNPPSRTVVVQDASISGLSFEALGPTKSRANSYDNGWESAWVAHARALLATSGKTAGFVLEVGDSITHSAAYAIWPRSGQGKTAEDTAVLSWVKSTVWGTNNVTVGNKNGWYLAAADTTSQRGMTASGGLSPLEFTTGCCNGGPTMPATSDAVAARQLVASSTYTGNLQVDTLVSAFADAQFAVLMLGTNDAGNVGSAAALTAIVDAFEAKRIIPILSTIPPRNDALGNGVNVQLNAAIRDLARSRSLPLIDFYQEIVLRRPGSTWSGTLISNDGVHPTATGGGFGLESNPYGAGGDASGTSDR